MERWSIKKLNETSDLLFAASVLGERKSQLIPYSPTAQKLGSAISKILKLDDFEKSGQRASTSVLRMAQIANNAMDYVGEMFNGEDLYNVLSGSFQMSDEEILAAGFSTLKPYMEADDEE